MCSLLNQIYLLKISLELDWLEAYQQMDPPRLAEVISCKAWSQKLLHFQLDSLCSPCPCSKVIGKKKDCGLHDRIKFCNWIIGTHSSVWSPAEWRLGMLKSIKQCIVLKIPWLLNITKSHKIMTEYFLEFWSKFALWSLVTGCSSELHCVLCFDCWTKSKTSVLAFDFGQWFYEISSFINRCLSVVWVVWRNTIIVGSHSPSKVLKLCPNENILLFRILSLCVCLRYNVDNFHIVSQCSQWSSVKPN